MTITQTLIVNHLITVAGTWHTPKDIAEAIGKSASTVRRQLKPLLDSGAVVPAEPDTPSCGVYGIPKDNVPAGNTKP